MDYIACVFVSKHLLSMAAKVPCRMQLGYSGQKEAVAYLKVRIQNMLTYFLVAIGVSTSKFSLMFIYLVFFII